MSVIKLDTLTFFSGFLHLDTIHEGLLSQENLFQAGMCQGRILLSVTCLKIVILVMKRLNVAR